MAKRPKKPKSPDQIQREKAMQRAAEFASVELQPEAANLPKSEDIEVRRTDRQTVAGARRTDAFDLLRDTMPSGAYDAARRLEADMRERRGETDKGRGLSRVDKTNLCLTSDARLAAGDRVDAALKRVGDRDAWLLTELIYPTYPRETWRDTVYHVTGERNPHAQAAAVRSACANLAVAYAVKVAA